jgi:hypothetical protein
MADSEGRYKVGPGRPLLHTRFEKGQSGAGASEKPPRPRSRSSARKSSRLEPNPPYFAARLKLPGTTTREVSLDPRIRRVTTIRSEDPLHFGLGFHAWVIGYFAKIASARLNALSIACSGVIPLFMTSSIATLNTCSALTSAIAGLNAS